MNLPKDLQRAIEEYDPDLDVKETGGARGHALAERMFQARKAEKQRRGDHPYKVTIPELNQFSDISGEHTTRANTPDNAVRKVVFGTYEDTGRARQAMAYLHENYDPISDLAKRLD